MTQARPALAGFAVLWASLALGASLAACSAAPAELPDGVTVSVFQNRFDYGVRQLELKVANVSDAPVTITRATFDSTRFATAAVFDRPQKVPSGGARDLRVQLGDPACGSTDRVDTVTLDFTLADGSTGTAVLVPTDELGRLEVINSEDCVGVALTAHAQISGPAEAVWTPGARNAAILDLQVTPTGAAGSATIELVSGTVLFSLVDASAAELYVQPVNLVIDAQSAPGTIRLLVVPARCDSHAIAEDKRGTFFPLRVTTTEGANGRVFVPMSDSVRESLYEFYRDFCGLK